MRSSPAVLRHPILPVRQRFLLSEPDGRQRVLAPDESPPGDLELDHRAICFFAAAGFFLADDTYFRRLRTLEPGREYRVDGRGLVHGRRTWFDWRSEPRDLTLDEAEEEFAALFESVVHEQSTGRRVVLPLSGGLDSRTQAVALRDHGDVHAYSYRFRGGHDETLYGRRIAEACGYRFAELEIPPGYLWSSLDRLARLNGHYSDFVHPRQMAVLDRLRPLGDVLSLGHWGDVLFDSSGVGGRLDLDDQVDVLWQKVVKRGGALLGERLWQAFGLAGTFREALRLRLTELLEAIPIDDANARIRAFKSLHWAPRWTSVNLGVFEDALPVELPYYDERICRFVCTMPERHLAERRIQIAYIRRRAPELARIPWQAFAPLDLESYESFHSPLRLPGRALRKVLRLTRERLSGRPLVERNWELQFLGDDNERQLRRWLLETPELHDLVPPEIPRHFHEAFRRSSDDALENAHAVGMLLTLAAFCRERAGQGRPAPVDTLHEAALAAAP